MTTKRFSLFAIVMAAFVLLVGCKKENNGAKIQNATNSMLKFNSFEEVIDYLANEDTTPTNYSFVSYGAMMDNAYYELDAENRFKSIEELKQFVSDNNKMYQLIVVGDDEYMFETRLYDHPFRNVANEEKMFQVADGVFKIVEGGFIATSFNNMDILRQYDFADKGIDKRIKTYFFNEDSASKDQTYNCGKSLYEEHTTGNNKITFKIDISGVNTGVGINYVSLRYFAKPYHYSIAWFGCNRTITVSLSSAMDYKKNNSWSRYKHTPFYTVATDTGSSYEKIYKISVGSTTIQDTHIGGTNSYALTYDAGKAELRCNTAIL